MRELTDVVITLINGVALSGRFRHTGSGWRGRDQEGNDVFIPVTSVLYVVYEDPQ